MNPHIQALQGQLKADYSRYSNNLKEGSPVQVRILADKGNGRYEASVAGTRIILSSEKTLKTGETFTGKIGLTGNIITISKNGETSPIPVQNLNITNITESGDLFSPVASPALASLLASLNLPSDNFSFQLLQTFKQMGMKFDSALLKKIRKEAEKSRNPKAKMEELVKKAQKKAFTKNPEDFDLPFFNSRQENPEKNKNQESLNNSHAKNINNINWLQEIKRFISQITQEDLENPKGELTVLNHLGFYKDKTTENSWVTIPFEMVNPFTEETSGSGKIMILLGASDKNFKQMNIGADFTGKKYRFAIYGTPGKSEIRKITFSIQQEGVRIDPESEIQKLSSVFSQNKKIPHIEFADFEKMNGLSSGLEEFSLAEGNI